jgi:hypothetical protein
MSGAIPPPGYQQPSHFMAILLGVHIQTAVNWASRTTATGPPTPPNG